MSAERRFLVDTSAWIETLRAEGDPAMRARISGLTADDAVVLCDQVRLELWNGARGAAEHRLLRDLEQQLDCVPTSDEVWALARDYARAARGQGLTLSAADLLIAACADCHGLGLIHQDAHFDQLAKITAGSSSWVSEARPLYGGGGKGAEPRTRRGAHPGRVRTARRRP